MVKKSNSNSIKESAVKESAIKESAINAGAINSAATTTTAITGKNTDDGEVSVLLTNRNGSYSLLSRTPCSRYEGVFFKNDNKLIKIIESLSFASNITAIINKLWGVTIMRDELSQTMFMPLNEDALVVELSAPCEFDLILDAKITEDNRIWGRNYEVTNEGHCVVVKFLKNNDGRDDNSSCSNEFEVYLALYAPALEYIPQQSWEEHFYKYDKERNSAPFSRWVFKACRIRTKNFVCAWALKKDDAIYCAKKVFESSDRLKRERETHVHSLISKIPKNNNSDVSLAYQCAVVALDGLTINSKKIIAGLPWFYQQWARDEIICSKAIMLQKDYEFAKNILFSYFSKITQEGFLPNQICTETSLLAADSIGWLFFRCNELLSAVSRKKSNTLSKKEKETIFEKLNFALSAIFKSRFVDGLIRTNKKETWIDTEFGDDSREGAAIEIQALVLFMCKMLRKLGDAKDSLEAELAQNVRKNFLKNKILLDIAGQTVVRPNLFIAAYIYPELLSNKEWEDCFDSVLPRLWLDWGGFSSIDKKSKLFCDTYSGEDNKSYHRGDSWFWLNNLAAIVLKRINSKKYTQYIKKILEASTSEILYMGATGFAAEVSSAKELSSKGCVAQSWSCALYIELVHELGDFSN